jgi:hypothetical protein
MTGAAPDRATDAEVLKVVKLLCIRERSMYGCIAGPALAAGDAFTVTVLGAFTRDIANRLGITRGNARLRLLKLKGAGYMLNKRRSGGCTRWWPVGLSAQLIAEESMN